MREPRNDGLSSAGEAPILSQIQEALESEVKSSTPPGVFVGRCTSGGNRDLFFYVPSPDGWTARLEAVRTTFSGYDIEPDVWEDRGWDAYFGFLLPTEEERQTIENRKVCEVLQSHGDSLEQPREIDHWIYFREPRQREEFQLRVAEMGFQTRGLPDSPSREAAYGVQIYRVDVPSYDQIDEVTLPLFGWRENPAASTTDGKRQC